MRGCRGALVWFCFVWLPFLRFWKGAAAPTKSGSGPGLVRVWFLNPGLVPANHLADGLGRLGGVFGVSWGVLGASLARFFASWKPYRIRDLLSNELEPSWTSFLNDF